MSSEIVAFIPARAGSKRIPNKNMVMLGGKPLILHTVKAAIDSGTFDYYFENIVISTDSELIYEHCKMFCTVIIRPPEYARDDSPDVEWLKHAIGTLDKVPQYFAILRPTSPFRTAETIQRAWRFFQENPYADSLRAVESVKQHPGKMWIAGDPYLSPFMNWPKVNGQASYNMPTQSLPRVYVQNASLEMGWTRNVLFRNNVSGQNVMPFFTQGYEGFDINTPEDLILAEALIERGLARLP